MPYSNMICIFRVGTHYHKNAHNDAEKIGYCPPGKVWETGRAAFDSGNDGGDECNEPSKLSESSVSSMSLRCGRQGIGGNVHMLLI